jgi:hypothetical protein
MNIGNILLMWEYATLLFVFGGLIGIVELLGVGHTILSM